MSTTPEIEMYQQAAALAKRRLLDKAKVLYGVVMGTDGETFGDTTMSRSDRILRWVVGSQDGTVDALASISPRIYERMLRQYQHDVMGEMEAAAKVRQ